MSSYSQKITELKTRQENRREARWNKALTGVCPDCGGRVRVESDDEQEMVVCVSCRLELDYRMLPERIVYSPQCRCHTARVQERGDLCPLHDM